MGDRHRRRAALPPQGFNRPASLDETSMIVTVYGESGGVEGVFDFTHLPGSPQLRRAFAIAMDRKSGPKGTWRSRATCQSGHQLIRRFLAWLSSQDEAPQTPQEITVALWNRWRMSLPPGRGARSDLAVLRVLMPMVPGIPAATLKVINRRIPKAPPTQETAYSRAEFERIRVLAAKRFNTALIRIRHNRHVLQRWNEGQALDEAQQMLGEALDCLLRTGDVPRSRSNMPPKRFLTVLEANTPVQTWGRLFLSQEEVFAAAVLLVADQGWNQSVLERMNVPADAPAIADAHINIHRVELRKNRRPLPLRHSTANLLDDGPQSAGRLLSRVIEATELARISLALQGQPTDRLLIYRRRAARAGDVFGLGLGNYGAVAFRWARAAAVLDDNGAPLSISLRRLRRTVQVLIRKEPAQNTQNTHESVYLLRDPTTRAAAEQTIAAGLTEALDHARTIVKMRTALGTDGTELTELSDDPALARAIARGDLDTATGACTNLTNSPFTPAGRPCTASFLLCLACPNAIATRRHLPRLVYLHQALDELRAVLDPPVWRQDWGEHFTRLSTLLETHTTPEERSDARTKVSERDVGLIDRLLRRGLDG